MNRTPDGLRIVDGMVELPRNPVDEKIDRLSEMAVRTLTDWTMTAGKPREQTYHGVTPWMQELWDAELVEESNGEMLDGRQVSWFFMLTFDGWNAAERIKCGIYARHREVEETRRARDNDMEAHPLYGLF